MDIAEWDISHIRPTIWTIRSRLDFRIPSAYLVSFEEFADPVVEVVSQRLKQFYPDLKGADCIYDREEGWSAPSKVFAEVYDVFGAGQSSVKNPGELATLVGQECD